MVKLDERVEAMLILNKNRTSKTYLSRNTTLSANRVGPGNTLKSDKQDKGSDMREYEDDSHMDFTDASRPHCAGDRSLDTTTTGDADMLIGTARHNYIPLTTRTQMADNVSEQGSDNLKMGGHRACRMFVVVLCFVVFLFALSMNILHALMMEPIEYDSGLFFSSTSNLTQKYSLEITPHEATFGIWGAIFLFQLFWMIYALTTLCTQTVGGFLYYSPPFISPVLYIFYTINMGCNVTWLFMWDREYLELSLAFLAACTFSSYLCMAVAMHSLNKHGGKLMVQHKAHHIRSAIALILNALGLYAGWISFGTLLELGVLLKFKIGISDHIASSIVLGAQSLVVVLYGCIDMVMFEKHFRYVYTPYLPVIGGLVGSLYQNWDLDKPNTVFTVAVLASISMLFLIKLIMSCVRCRSHPVFKRPVDGVNAQNHLDK